MLVLSRKPGETVVIGDAIQLTVVEIRGSIVRLGLTAPRHVPIYREELGAKAESQARGQAGPSEAPASS